MPEIKVEDDPEITMGPTRAVTNGSRRKNGKATRNGSINRNGHANGSSYAGATVKQEEEEPKFTDDNTFSDDDYVDDEYEGIAEDENGTEYWVCKEIRIPQVPKPTIVMHTLVDLYNISKGPYMNLEPEYQREVVWDEHRSSELIKSIFIGYFIPPLIFNVLGPKFESDDKGVKKEKYYRVCVDGKQRMTSVLKFMDGHIGFFDASHPPKKWYYRHPVINGVEKITNRNIMPEAMKKKFRESKFCCYEYVALSASTEETMFQLVQRGIALTPAERMKAMSTEWAQFTKKYEEEYSMVVNLSKQTRASGFRTVLTIFTMIQEVMARAEAGRTGIPTLQSSPQALNKVLNDREPISESLKFEFKEVFGKFAALVKFCSTKLEEPYERWIVNRNTAFDPAPDFLKEETVNHVKTYSPLELLATGILLAKHMRNRSDSLLLGDIKEMRHFLREKHKDLRVNAQCWVSTWEFLDFELLKRRGGPNGEPMPNARRHSVMMAEIMARDGEEFDIEDPDATISAENSGIEDGGDEDEEDVEEEEDEDEEEEEEEDVDIVHALFGASADAQSKRLRRPSGSSSRSSSSSGTFSKRPKK